MKKNFKIIITLLVIMLFSTSAFATTNPIISYSEYLELQSEGIIGEDVSYEYLNELYSKSNNLEENLKNSNQFESIAMSSDVSSVSLKVGDVLITNGTSSAGLLGHAGIAISSNEILHISGPGNAPQVISPTVWANTYENSGWTKVYRNTSSVAARKASYWAEDTYEGSNAEYKITMDLSVTDENYCSKMVWQAYYYGAGTQYANGPTWGVRLPYDLPTTVKVLEEI